MGKLLFDKTAVVDNPESNGLKKQQEKSSDSPPQIPPRMKKKGPALPEKPAHMRAKSNTTIVLSSQPTREPLRPRILNMDKDVCSQREVLVAASKAAREKPVDKRQREPPKLLMPTGGGGSSKKVLNIPSIHVNDYVYKKELSVLPSKGPIRLEDCIPSKKDLAILPSSKNPLWSHEGKRIDHKIPMTKKTNRPIQPVLLIPRSLLTWGSTPVSYALWSQRDVGKGGGIRPVKQSPIRMSKSGTSDTSAVRVRSGSVTRSGSLTSQGSSSSDSGGETFPKSVLKKQKRSSASSSTTASKASSSNHKVDQKKNVTFNAFATVQLMEE